MIDHGHCPVRAAGPAPATAKASSPQTAASTASELSMAGLMPGGRSRSLGGFEVPKEPTPPKQACRHACCVHDVPLCQHALTTLL